MPPKTGLITREWRVAQPSQRFEGLQLQESQIGPLGATDVLVKVHAVSIQHRDIMVAKGQYPLPQVCCHTALGTNLMMVPCSVKPSTVLGSDAAGEVICVGSEVTNWRVGDRVAANFHVAHIHGALSRTVPGGALGAEIDGVLSTYKMFPAEALVAIPAHLSFDEASTLPCAAVTAYNALIGGPHPLKGGDTVLVEGTGGVATFAVQIALASGATPIVLTSSNRKAETLRKLGVEHIINYREVPNWDVEVLKLTAGEGVDRVIEVCGGQTINKAIQCTRFDGTISAIGIVDEAVSSPDLLVHIIKKGVIVRGIKIGSRTQFENMNRLFSARQVRPVVDKIFSFDDLVEALQYLDAQKHVGKVVVKVA
ncbi:NAD(P)-binding protein [Auricularia subglabra TFB-10046 SS5]|nr:NAD(P)-binding protein [Auricularia subglabra TFB-10046 SS5]